MAFALLDRAIAKDPDNYDALQLKGDLLFAAKGDATAALEAERQALAGGPTGCRRIRASIEILLARGDLAAAKTQIEQMKKVLPNHPANPLLRGPPRLPEPGLQVGTRALATAVSTRRSRQRQGPSARRRHRNAGRFASPRPRASSQGGAATPRPRRSRGACWPRSRSARVQPQKAQVTLQPLLDKPDVEAETLNLAAQAALQLGDAKNAEAVFRTARRR